jgi:PhnB protein
MNDILNTYKPDNFHTVTPYLFVDKPQLLIDFLKNAFFAKEINRSVNPTNGDIANCILQIGDTCFMISQAREQFEGMRTALYLFVDDVEAVHQLTLRRINKSTSTTFIIKADTSVLLSIRCSAIPVFVGGLI